jgi:hypothetical protein
MCGGLIAAQGGADAVFSDAVLANAYGMDVGVFMRESLECWKNSS